jgi:two-component system heavy metal sensor histidine kinase CusS
MHRGDVFARSEGGINTFGLTFALVPERKPQSEVPSFVAPLFEVKTDNIVSKSSA